MNADLNGAINILYILSSLIYISPSPWELEEGLPAVRNRGNGPEARPAVYCWTNGAGWVIPASNEGEGCKPQTNGRPERAEPMAWAPVKGAPGRGARGEGLASSQMKPEPLPTPSVPRSRCFSRA